MFRPKTLASSLTHVCPMSRASANPVASTFRIYPESKVFSPLPGLKPQASPWLPSWSACITLPLLQSFLHVAVKTLLKWKSDVFTFMFSIFQKFFYLLWVKTKMFKMPTSIHGLGPLSRHGLHLLPMFILVHLQPQRPPCCSSDLRIMFHPGTLLCSFLYLECSSQTSFSDTLFFF